MTIPLSGTFDYVVVVPEKPTEPARWQAQLRTPVVSQGDSRRDDRLVGYSPMVYVTPYGIAPETEARQAQRPRPKVLRSRFTLIASEQKRSRAAAVAFDVDQSLTAVIRPRDVLSMSRTTSGGLGLSLLRDNQLVFAVGAVTAVPLGDTVRVRLPVELITRAAAVFRQRDPSFEFPHLPIEIEVGEERCVVFATRSQFGAYQVWVEHGCYRGAPGVDECVAISLQHACPDVVAIASAQLLDHPDPIRFEPWPNSSAV
jgi:hypothetical protein